jgi:DNA-binding response OmpR family regulator
MHQGTIAIVEDEGLIALQMIEVLEKAGYTIFGSFYSGSQAIRALETSRNVDLILMDITLVGTLDGIETARKIRQQLSIPLIFVTAHTSERMQKKMHEVAHNGVIFKPFASEELLALIDRTLCAP